MIAIGNLCRAPLPHRYYIFILHLIGVNLFRFSPALLFPAIKLATIADKTARISVTALVDRQAALTRAMEMFWARGYANTSLTDLTRAMNIAPPSFYAAFGSKDALYEESLRLFIAHHGGKMWEQIETTPTLLDAIEAFLKTSATAFADSGHPPGCMMIAGLQEMERDEGASAAWLRSQWDANRRKMQGRFKRAITEGDAPGGFDCRTAADFVLTLQAGLSNAARLSLSRTHLVSVANLGRQSIETMLTTVR
ncbi:TetR/AcrR family transcriptional regulator [uncultured Roseobacter sp.]|uniref:TetR/AcrR family transcriptional regulator n=1 Tax=uncultured Roseobacter sp. TaxID=114847 RepID=UPI00262AF5F6|nr:TetR/AcrR family transcriptional regulator [uncultured Roseobacter sp.]